MFSGSFGVRSIVLCKCSGNVLIGEEVLEGGEEGWIENGRDSKRCKWTVVKRK